MKLKFIIKFFILFLSNINQIMFIKKFSYFAVFFFVMITISEAKQDHLETSAELEETIGHKSFSDGTGSGAGFLNIMGMTSLDDDIYFIDTSTVRKLDLSNNRITTLAGRQFRKGKNTDGIGPSARFGNHMEFRGGIATDGKNLYIGESHKIRKMNLKTNEVTTIAGRGKYYDDTNFPKRDGVGLKAIIDSPNKMITVKNDIYFLDQNGIRVLNLDTNEVTTFIADSDKNLPAIENITTDGNYIYAVSALCSIFRIEIANKKIIPIAKLPYCIKPNSKSFECDGGTYISTADIVADGKYIYVIGSTNFREPVAKKIDIKTGKMSDFLKSITSILFDERFIANRIHMVKVKNKIYFKFDSESLHAISLDTEKTDFVAGVNHNDLVQDEESNSVVINPIDFVSRNENLYFTDGNHPVVRFYNSKNKTVTAISKENYWMFLAGLHKECYGCIPAGITVDSKKIYLTIPKAGIIQSMDIETGSFATIAGKINEKGINDGNKENARFNDPKSITNDGKYLYIADTGNFTIRKMNIDSGDVTTLAGQAGQSGFQDGKGESATFSSLRNILYVNGALYTLDGFHIRKISLSGEVSTFASVKKLSLPMDDSKKTSKSEKSLEVEIFRDPPEVMQTDGENIYVSSRHTYDMSFSSNTEAIILKINLKTGTTSVIASLDSEKTTNHPEIQKKKYTGENFYIFIKNISDMLVNSYFSSGGTYINKYKIFTYPNNFKYDEESKTVTDTNTHLVWTRVNYRGRNTNFSDTLTACKGFVSHHGSKEYHFRLPTIAELKTIIGVYHNGDFQKSIIFKSFGSYETRLKIDREVWSSDILDSGNDARYTLMDLGYGDTIYTASDYVGHDSVICTLDVLSSNVFLKNKNLNKTYLGSKENVHQRDANNKTPLFYAAVSGDKELLKKIIINGADVNARDIDGDNVLLELIFKGKGQTKDDLDIFKILLGSGANINSRNRYDQTPVAHAIMKNLNDLVDLLFTQKIENIHGNDGYTLLHYAADNNNLHAIKLIFRNFPDADLNIKNTSGATPLLKACSQNNPDIVELFLGQKADPNIPNKYSYYPLHFAARSGNLEIVKLLVNNGAKHNVVNEDGDTPLKLAKKFKHEDVYEFLQKRGAK